MARGIDALLEDHVRLFGHGIDVADIGELQAVMEPTPHALQGYLSRRERDAVPDGPTRWAHIASRLALKEAVVKALGTGFVGDLVWTDIEVLNEPSGMPFVELCGEAGRLAHERGINGWMVSVSHTSNVVVGSAIALMA